MQDRVPLYPGRVTLTPVAGQENTFDMARADQPTQEGTPLNKSTLLKDGTAEKYGMDNTAVPDDLFALLKDSVLLKTLSNAASLYWEKLPNFPNVDRPILACTNSVVMVVPYYHNTSKEGYRSKDGGKTWEKINLPITNISSFSAVHGFFIAVTNGVCCYSSDGGETWTQKSSTSNAEAYACWSGSRFVFVDSFGYSYFTDDFKTVTRGGSLTQGCYVVCCGDNGRIVTLGNTTGNTAKAAYSDDEGSTWTNVSRPNTSVANSINSIAYLPGVGFISVAADGKRVLISETGESWQIHPINGTTLSTAGSSLHLTVVGDTLFASCQGAAIAWTKDGKNWTPLNVEAEWLVYVENQNGFILSTGMRGGFASELTDIFKNLLKIPISQINGFTEPLEYGTYIGTGYSSKAITLTKKRKLLVVMGTDNNSQLCIAIIVLPNSGTSLCGFGAIAEKYNSTQKTPVSYSVTVVNDRTVAISVSANSYTSIQSLDQSNISYSYVAIG